MTATGAMARKRSVDDVMVDMMGAMASRKKVRMHRKTPDPARQPHPPAMKAHQGPKTAKTGAPKKPVAAPAAAAICSIQRNYSRNCIVVKFGTGPGSTKSLSFGPTGAKQFRTSQEAEEEADRLVKLGSRTGERPW